jgi:hypothetical protein
MTPNENFVIKTDQGYFQHDLHCTAYFTQDINKAAKYDKFNATTQADFLNRFLAFEVRPEVVKL